jgi:hypothetical protein
MFTVYIIEPDEKPNLRALAEADIAIQMLDGGQRDRHFGVAEWEATIVKHRDFDGDEPARVMRDL